jgi:c-di-GMP-binding flagellar brake protein YcgR
MQARLMKQSGQFSTPAQPGLPSLSTALFLPNRRTISGHRGEYRAHAICLSLYFHPVQICFKLLAQTLSGKKMAETEVQADSEPSPTVFELEQSDAYSKFLLHSKSEILAILRALMQKGAMITVHFDKGRSFLLTSIIDLNAENRSFILDVGSNEDMNRKALIADHLIFTTIIDKVKIQFKLDGLAPVQSGGRPAFLARMPESLLRLQRREFFRLATPIAKPVKLNASVRCADASMLCVELPLMDISGGGVGLLATPDQVKLFQRDDTLNECKIMLPDEGMLVTTLCVRNLIDLTSRNGSHFFRIGCEFVALSAARLSLVQRYITRVERERRARQNGMG